MVDVDVLWGFLFVFIVFGLLCFKGRLGGRFSGFSMVERKCICVSVFYVISNNIKYMKVLLCLRSLVN